MSDSLDTKQPKYFSFNSSRANQLTASAITEIVRMAFEHKAIDLALGAPDFPAPDEIKEAAAQAIYNNTNQYANFWGDRALRSAIAEKTIKYLNVETDPETEITVTCGATEAMFNVLMAIIDPGDEVIIFEPFYENYTTAASFSGAVLRYVPLYPPDWDFDEQELGSLFNNKTKAIIINTPNNPTGKVFSHKELHFIGELCHKWNALCLTDEIYEHMVFDDTNHISMLQIDGMRERTVLINSLSKTYSITGWRIGYIIAPAEITRIIRNLHAIITAGAPAPLQVAAYTALRLPDSYYHNLCLDFQNRRDYLTQVLSPIGFCCYSSRGGYFLMADISYFGFDNDVEFTKFLIEKIGVAAIPGSSFYVNPANGSNLIRFCFCKTDATLAAAKQRLIRLTQAV